MQGSIMSQGDNDNDYVMTTMTTTTMMMMMTMTTMMTMIIVSFINMQSDGQFNILSLIHI